jgi:tetratricopeptide (TPR) repeat protein
MFLLVMMSVLQVRAQDVSKMMESARAFSQKGDFANALLVLNKANTTKPGDLEIQKELAYTYYRAGNYKEAVPVAQTIINRDDADVQSYQIAGNIYKAMGDPKEFEKTYKAALKKFPNSGALYFEYGEVMLTQQQSNEAIKLWEKGIEVDPSYPGNYYHAGKYYYYTGTNPALTLLYSEIFVNMESYTVRTAEMKNVLLDAYKNFYLQKPEPKSGKKKQVNFQQSVANVLALQSDVASNGITPETLTMIRARFVLSWYDKPAAKFPYKLFEQMQFLLREGMFEAYNQWLFGPVTDLSRYQQWTNTNAQKVNDFAYYQKNRVFKMPPGQFYQ